jgi:hypothetical protein
MEVENTQPTISMVERPLFGGAITCHIPANYRNVADIRQVPDNQECWQGMDGRLFVVEIMERQEVSDPEAAAFFFQDLAESNGCDSANLSFTAQRPVATDSSVMQGLPADTVLCTGSGRQRVARGRDTDVAGNPRQQEVHTIHIELCLIRLPTQRTDLLITLSSPLETDLISRSKEIFEQVLSTFQIRNWGLFGR